MSLKHKRPTRHNYLCALLLGCTCYAISNGLVHKSDWCYLAASAAVAAVVSAGLRPVHGWLVRQRPRWLHKWPLLWALSCTLAIFGVGVLLTWPLRSWPGPGGLWPWGAGALLATAWGYRRGSATTDDSRNRNNGRHSSCTSHNSANSNLIIKTLNRQFCGVEVSHFGNKKSQKYN